MICPRCRGAMRVHRAGLYEDIPLQGCHGCGALWMPGESLDRLDDNINVDASKLEWERGADEEHYRCPACPAGYRETGAPLTRLILAWAPDVVVHRCTRCAHFLLDEDTLERMRQLLVRWPG